MARFDCAVWRPVSNWSGTITDNRGLILHHAVAVGSLFDWFDNPSSGVSAHFWVGQDGTIEQYVDSDCRAWHGMALNNRYCGVETEGCSSPPYADPMSDAMVAALAALYAEGAARHGWANALAEADGDYGFGYHRMAVNTACPCDTRVNTRPEILELAFGGDLPDTAPVPPPATSSSAPPWPGRYLKYPPLMQGTDVHTWQLQMRARGWDLDADGVYGPLSSDVCWSFQIEKGLAVDGIVGPETWDATWSAPVT